MSISVRNRQFLLQQRLQQRRREAQDINLTATNAKQASENQLQTYIASGQYTAAAGYEAHLSGNR